MRDQAANYQVGMNRISLGMVGIGIMVTLVRFAAFGDDFIEGLLRFIAVVAVLGLTVPINNLSYNTWDKLRVAAVDTIQPTMNSAADELVVLGTDSFYLMLVAAAPAGMAATATSTAKEVGYKMGARASKQLARWLNGALIPVFFFVLLTYGIILLSGLGLVFAAILLPVSASMIMMSAEAGEKWMSTYIQFTIGSLLTVALMPVAFSAAFNLTVVQPIANVNESFSDSAEVAQAFQSVNVPGEVGQLNDELSGLYAEQKRLQAQVSAEGGGGTTEPRILDRLATLTRSIGERSAGIRQAINNWEAGVLDTVNTAVYQALNQIRGWLIRLVLLFILAGIGSYIILVSSSSITGLVGGASLAVARQMARPMSGLAKANIGRGGGGGGGSTTTTSKGAVGSASAAGALTQGTTKAVPAGPGAGGVTPNSSATSAAATRSSAKSATPVASISTKDKKS